MSSYLYLLVHYFDRINIKNQMLEYIIVKSTNRERKREIEWAKENLKQNLQAWRTIIRIQKFACQSSVDLVFLSI